MFEFFATIKHFQKHIQHTSKDAESSLYTIKESSATRFKCYNSSNDKIQQLYADTNKLHKCLKFLLKLNIFKNTHNTHQKMQNSSLYTITPLLQPDSNATKHKTRGFNNSMPSRTNCISVLKILPELKIFKNTNNTHQKMQNSSLYMITPLLQPDSNATIHQTARFSNCMQTRTNCISVWILCYN